MIAIGLQHIEDDKRCWVGSLLYLARVAQLPALGKIVEDWFSVVDAHTFAVEQSAIGTGVQQRWSETDYLSRILNKVGTGVRRGELLSLKWSDLDLNRKTSTATIQRSLQRHVGRGLLYKEPKSKKGRRTLVLMPYIAEYLRQHKIKQAEKKLALGPALYQDNDLVFVKRMARRSSHQNLF